MATEITAIQCPKCGSTGKTELRADHYRCESCGTEYFLDNGNTSPSRPPGIVDPRRPVTPARRIYLAIVFIVLILVGFVRMLVISPSDTVSAPEPPTWQYVYQYVYLSADGRPIVVGIGTLTDNKVPGQLPEPYIFFFDALKGTLIKRFQIPGRDHTTTSDGWDFQQLSNGDLYVDAERKQLYKIDKASYSIKDVTQTFGEDQPELAGGIAAVALIPSGNNDGFAVVTNDGKDLWYFPLIHKVYKQREFWDAQTGMITALPGAVAATAFCFTSLQHGDDDDSIRLIKYRFLDNGSGPKKTEYPFWQPSGQPAPINPDFQRILSRANFTPGRLYFSPEVLYSDSDYVLISYAPTAAKSGWLVQCLDAHTADIVFTTQLDNNSPGDGATRYKGGFAIYNIGIELIDMKGKIKKLKYDNENGS